MHSRRSFLAQLGKFALLLIGGSLWARKSGAWWFGGGGGEQWLSLGKVKDFPDGKATVIDQAVRVADGKTVKRPKLIALRTGEKVSVMSTKCTHFGCEVKHLDNGSYQCPCHGATFDSKGAVTKGPAKKALSWYEVQVAAEGDVQVNVGKPLEVSNQ
ncbi:MAG: Rieske (2Fe-2S) protein [bacterium]